MGTVSMGKVTAQNLRSSRKNFLLPRNTHHWTLITPLECSGGPGGALPSPPALAHLPFWQLMVVSRNSEARIPKAWSSVFASCPHPTLLEWETCSRGRIPKETKVLVRKTQKCGKTLELLQSPIKFLSPVFPAWARTLKSQSPLCSALSHFARNQHKGSSSSSGSTRHSPPFHQGRGGISFQGFRLIILPMYSSSTLEESQISNCLFLPSSAHSPPPPHPSTSPPPT